MKKGSLSLSINAIVVVVLAFVMLGLGLTLTNTIFRSAGDQLPAVFGAIELGTTPTAEKPLTVQDINVKRGSSVSLEIGYYNLLPNNVQNAIPNITQCIDASTGNTITNTADLPQINALSQGVGPSEIVGYRAIINIAGKNEFVGGKQFICELAIEGEIETGATTIQETLKTTQFQIQVTS
ncbi:MAG: hypothetical protein ACMXYC_01345 [Candidatus Woesearchaeota archaeon]